MDSITQKCGACGTTFEYEQADIKEIHAENRPDERFNTNGKYVFCPWCGKRIWLPK